MKLLLFSFLSIGLMGLLADGLSLNGVKSTQDSLTSGPFVMVLGTLQDGGSPHIGCNKSCCKLLFENPALDRMVVSLGVVDPLEHKKWLFEATPDFPRQMKLLSNACQGDSGEAPDGIFLTHAHIGHYAGLMYLGREAMNAREVKVWAMPRMKNYLQNNGPWSQLVGLKNMVFGDLRADSSILLGSQLTVKAIQVPHRDEYSETVGYIVTGPRKKLLFIPDIDKWSKWNRDILQLVREVDYAFIDATFYSEQELTGRSMKEIPHPLVKESMELFENLNAVEKDKIYFTHFNHTNPLLLDASAQTRQVLSKGYHVARLGLRLPL